ncbi:myelin protein P0-like isoform X1 [Triplophysa rosa]|uniref:Myelin protein P0-like n=1 Tax=Triplophysa rosa TaxID=992332 RepID=A0A9W7WR07_TRIRA|nr:myelin protein P0-like isoform X1 [Triplophysa rosa]KAI7806792.1 putative myelin protein P0-like [Triplophysa rosa]
MELHGTFIPLLLFCTTLLKVLQGQRVDTDGEVIGYQNHDVTLTCHYIHGKTEDNLSQVQWTWQNHSHKHDPIVIIINHQEYGTTVHNTSLKERVSFIERPKLTPDASIIIKDVKMTDQGVYSCDYTTYPSGTKTGVTTLKVKEGKPAALSTAAIAGIVTVVIIIILLASASYLLLLKKRRAASTSANYVTQKPDELNKGEVTYADVTILRPDKVNRNTLLTGDIEYAAVSFSGRSRMTSQQGSANQLACGAQTEEHGSVYAEVKKD